MGSVQLFGQQRRSVALSTMKSTIGVGVAVISSVLLIGHFCTFVSCGSSDVQPGNPLLISNRRTKRSPCNHHHTLCTSTGDPHITTFHGNYYNFYGVGVYTLVKLNFRSLWIQAYHVPCNGPASCNCGVMAREGNKIIGITKCNHVTPLLVEYELDSQPSGGGIQSISGGWQITLLSGINIQATMWEGGQFMHLSVTGLSSELGHYEGLCSVSLPHNSICNDWTCERYRVPDDQSYFSITQNNLPPCENPSIHPHCVNPSSEYRLKVDVKKSCSKYKRQDDENGKENAVSNDEDAIGLEDLPTDTKITEVHDRELNMGYRFLDYVRALNPRAKLSVEDGKSRCNDALKLSPTYEICSERVDASAIVKSCALDVELMNEYGPAKSVPTEFETACLDNIRLSLESDTISEASLQELKALLARVEKLVCPSQCSQNGRCVDSKCQCNEGFMGTDCSLTIGQAPVIKKIIMPVCDIRKHPCTQIHVEASDLTTPEDVVCKMRSVNDVDGAVPAVQTSTPVISAGLVVCDLPQMPVRVKESENGKSTTVFLVQVSISNDGQTYSKELPFTVVDGHCMECPASQDTPCQLKENTCSIGGRCYKAEESCPLDTAKICKPAKCTTKWTSESSTSCDDGFENCT